MFRSLTVSICFVLLVVFESLAANYYIDATNGSDSNPGTSPSKAWKSIGKVNSSIFAPGDSVLFKRGEVWNRQINITQDGLPGKPVVFGAYGIGGKKPKIDLKDEKGYGFHIDKRKHFVVQDFEITNPKVNGIYAWECIDYVLAHNHIHHTGSHGINANPNKDNNYTKIVEQNLIHDTPGDAIGSHANGDGSGYTTIRYNHIYNTGNDGIDILGSTGSVIQGNLVHTYKDFGGKGASSLIKCGGNTPDKHPDGGGRKNKVVNNIAFDFPVNGIYCKTAVRNLVRGNLVFDCKVFDYHLYSPDYVPMHTIDSNICVGTEGDKGLIYIGGPQLEESVDHNLWINTIMKVRPDVGEFSINEFEKYRQVMKPHEQNTTNFASSFAVVTPYWAAGLSKDIQWNSQKDSLLNKWPIKLNGKSYDLIVVKFGSPTEPPASASPIRTNTLKTPLLFGYSTTPNSVHFQMRGPPVKLAISPFTISWANPFGIIKAVQTSHLCGKAERKQDCTL